MNTSFRNRIGRITVVMLLVCSSPREFVGAASNSSQLSRPDRPWEFIAALGQQAGLFGDEMGRLEAWVYPLKILRNFQLRFLAEGTVIPAASLARTVTVRPEATTILYVSDTFTARETIFVPVHEPGAVITIEVTTTQPMEIQAAFERDFQLMWPAAIGGSYFAWDYDLNAFSFGDDLNHYAAFVGSPDATEALQDYESNYSQSKECSFRLGPIKAGHATKVIVIAGSIEGHEKAADAYRRNSAKYQELLREASEYYESYLNHTAQLELPDAELQRAYDWSRISMLQGLVSNPNLGTGLVAGYRTSGDSLRPGFAWFFGRDALWTSLALNAEGDFATSRTALEFLLKYQRDDGKITHEVSQSAGIIPWFKEYPYAYASADATPLFLIAADDYVSQSGDLAFAKQSWEQIWKAHQFLRSTSDADGFAQNRGVGHGWVEGGPLRPVDVEFYQAGLGIEADRAVGHLAHLLAREDTAKELADRSETQKQKLNESFWSPEKNFFAFARNHGNERVDVLTVLAAVPMWFHLLADDKAEKTIDLLADSDFETDWGTRLLSSRDPRYAPSGYHYGSVWPLFTGWASVGEYGYHRALPAFSNLRANAMLAFDGTLGHFTEVLSGDNYQALAGSSTDQIWSAAMVVSPLLRGMLGLEVAANLRQLSFSPHVPANWNAFAVRNVQIASESVDLDYRRTSNEIVLETTLHGDQQVSLVFSPAISLRARILGVEVGGRSARFQISSNSEDQHVSVKLNLEKGKNLLRIGLQSDFGLSIMSDPTALGSSSHGLRVVSESWSAARDALVVDFEGIAGESYKLAAINSGDVLSVDGGQLLKADDGQTFIRVQPAARVLDATTEQSSSANPYSRGRITIHFSERTIAARQTR